jgi:hypothetical protein
VQAPFAAHSSYSSALHFLVLPFRCPSPFPSSSPCAPRSNGLSGAVAAVWAHGLLGRYSTNMCPRSIGSARSTLLSSCVFDMAGGWVVAGCWRSDGLCSNSKGKGKKTNKQREHGRESARKLTAARPQPSRRRREGTGGEGRERDSPSLSVCACSAASLRREAPHCASRRTSPLGSFGCGRQLVSSSDHV